MWQLTCETVTQLILTDVCGLSFFFLFIYRYLFHSGNPEHPGDILLNTTVEVLPFQVWIFWFVSSPLQDKSKVSLLTFLTGWGDINASFNCMNLMFWCSHTFPSFNWICSQKTIVTIQMFIQGAVCTSAVGNLEVNKVISF